MGAERKRVRGVPNAAHLHIFELNAKKCVCVGVSWLVGLWDGERGLWACAIRDVRFARRGRALGVRKGRHENVYLSGCTGVGKATERALNRPALRFRIAAER